MQGGMWKCSKTRKKMKLTRREDPKGGEAKKAYISYQIARARKKRIVKSMLQSHHRRLIEEATGDIKKTWKLVRWIKTQETLYQPATPYIKQRNGTTANIPSAKTACLAKLFFPQALATDLEDIQTTIYPDPVAFPDITLEEI